MKPYDGGAGAVFRASRRPRAHTAIRRSAATIAHALQKAVDYDVFARYPAIGIRDDGDEVPATSRCISRYAVSHSSFDAVGDEVVKIGSVNAFFRWEFKLLQTLRKGGEVLPIDSANAARDVGACQPAHYLPWAVKALGKWSVFALVTGRRPRLDWSPTRSRGAESRTCV